MTKVLVVEDNELNLDLMLEIVSAMGFTVQSVMDGKKAIKIAEKETYDLILMDIELPDMDGIEAARKIRERQEHKNTPIIALTAYAMKGDRERFLTSGFSEYIPKPFIVKDVLNILEKYKN